MRAVGLENNGTSSQETNAAACFMANGCTRGTCPYVERERGIYLHADSHVLSAWSFQASFKSILRKIKTWGWCFGDWKITWKWKKRDQPKLSALGRMAWLLMLFKMIQFIFEPDDSWEQWYGDLACELVGGEWSQWIWNWHNVNASMFVFLKIFSSFFMFPFAKFRGKFTKQVFA